jgi:hypothetical protein
VGTAYWLLCHAGYLAVQLLALRIHAVVLSPGHWNIGALAATWVRWDGIHYVTIAEEGYPANPQPEFQRYDDSVRPAWPPGYPLLIRVANWLLPGEVNVAALAVSNLAALGLLVVLYRFVEMEVDAVTAERTLLCLLVFPTAFFLAAAYSESVFLLLTVAALYCARRQHWWWAGVLAGAASSVRVAGVTLIVAFALEYLRQRDFNWRRIRPDVLALGLVPSGLVAYMAYQWVRYDNPFMFSEAQKAWGRGSIVMPWRPLIDSLRDLNIFANTERAVITVIDLGLLAVALALLVLGVVGPWKLRRDQLFLIVAGALPLLVAILQPIGDPGGPPWQSMDRYALACFPIFLIMAKLASHRLVERLVVFVGLPLQVGLLIIYLGGGWAG